MAAAPRPTTRAAVSCFDASCSRLHIAQGKADRAERVC
jgi:hypothetical protein